MLQLDVAGSQQYKRGLDQAGLCSCICVRLEDTNKEFMLTSGLFLAGGMPAVGGRMILDLANSPSQKGAVCCKPEAAKLTCRKLQHT